MGVWGLPRRAGWLDGDVRTGARGRTGLIEDRCLQLRYEERCPGIQAMRDGLKHMI